MIGITDVIAAEKGGSKTVVKRVKSANALKRFWKSLTLAISPQKKSRHSILWIEYRDLAGFIGCLPYQDTSAVEPT